MVSPPGILVLLAWLALSHSTTTTNTSTPASMDMMESQLESLLVAALDKHLPSGRAEGGRERRQVQSAEQGALMYLPIGGAGNVRCSLSQRRLVLRNNLII